MIEGGEVNDPSVYMKLDHIEFSLNYFDRYSRYFLILNRHGLYTVLIDAVNEYMMKNNCIIGGEQSGHIIFSKYATTGDGILTSLKMMQVMISEKKKMSELCEGFTVYPQVLENVRVQDKVAAKNDPEVKKAVDKAAEALGDSGRILVRESGTEPLIRVMVEAKDEAVCKDMVDSVVKVIKANGHTDEKMA